MSRPIWALSYYFMPLNVYVTGAVGLDWMSVAFDEADGDDRNGTTPDAGPGINLDVGKEWRVGNL